MPFIEGFLTIHGLLAISSLLMGGRWLLQQPSLKLRLARLVFASCILSPAAVHLVKQADRPILGKFVSLDALSDYTHKPFVNSHARTAAAMSVKPIQDFEKIDYRFLLLIVLVFGILYQGRRLLKDLRKIQAILSTTQTYRTKGRLSVQVSDRCLIPFSTRFLGRAYIILPVSLVNYPPLKGTGFQY